MAHTKTSVTNIGIREGNTAENIHQSWPEIPFTLIRTVSPPPHTGPQSVSIPPSQNPASPALIRDENKTPDAKTIHVARLMALTHNTIFRALNAIYTQSFRFLQSLKDAGLNPKYLTDYVAESEKDVFDLLTFTKFTVSFLQNHHRCEELVFFPMLEAQAKTPGMMKADVDQHRAFEFSLKELEGFVEEGIKNRGKGFGEEELEKLREKIEALGGPLGQHLREEIGRLLEVGMVVGGETMEVCYKALHDEAEGTTDAFE